jgi:hypothetical protein
MLIFELSEQLVRDGNTGRPLNGRISYTWEECVQFVITDADHLLFERLK